MGRMGKTVEEPVHAFEHRARSEKPATRQQRRAKTRLRGPSGMQALGPGAFGEIFDDAAGHAAGNTERIDDLSCIKSKRGATPAAAPIAPKIAVGWKPDLCTAFGTTRLSRHSTSVPTAIPISAMRPSGLCRSQAAKTAGTTTAPACTGPPSKVSSKSSPWAAVPLTKAAPAAVRVRL